MKVTFKLTPEQISRATKIVNRCSIDKESSFYPEMWEGNLLGNTAVDDNRVVLDFIQDDSTVVLEGSREWIWACLAMGVLCEIAGGKTTFVRDEIVPEILGLEVVSIENTIPGIPWYATALEEAVFTGFESLVRYYTKRGRMPIYVFSDEAEKQGCAVAFMRLYRVDGFDPIDTTIYSQSEREMAKVLYDRLKAVQEQYPDLKIV